MRRKIRNGLFILINSLVIILLIMSLIPNKVGMNAKVESNKLITGFSYNYIEVEKLVDDEILENPIAEPAVEVVVENKSNVINEVKSAQTRDDSRAVIDTYYGTLTAYGPDCYGCSGVTRSGYDVRNTTIYVDDEFGAVRVLAGDWSIPVNSIIRIKIGGSEPIIGIVLDRGGGVGFNKFSTFDILYESEAVATTIGTKYNVTFELLRSGN